jgi:tRNA threonylcarbamoyladenosine biosynthesis protein TsaE
MSPGTNLPSPSAVVSRMLTSASAETTRALAARLADAARPGDLIALTGELGAGKTQFAKGFATGLGVEATVNSPSFVLMTEYLGRLPLFHLDLYRLTDGVDVWSDGLIDDRQADGVTVVEWAERLGAGLLRARLAIHIEGTGDDVRAITVTAPNPGYRRYLEALG